MRIPVMNVSRQYESIADRLDETVSRVLHSGKYILGEEVESFEAAYASYCGVKYAVGVGNGTDALILALKACGIGAGDEVITSAMSFVATAEAIASVGATPAFVDCTNDTYTLDVEKIKGRITSRTKAIIPVHLYGQCADMNKINAIAKEYGLKVIEDAAQAAGAEYNGKKAGSMGDVGCFSFFPTKNLGCAGDGGMIITNDETIYKCCKAFRVHGCGTEGAFAYEVFNNVKIGDKDLDFHGNLPKYYNFVCGHNTRLDAIQAAILMEKLQCLEKWNERRRLIASAYEKGISNPLVTKPFVANTNNHIYYVYVLTMKKRDDFRKYMEKCGIGTGVYFPVPLHKQRVFEKLDDYEMHMPNAEKIAQNSVVIPMYPELEDEEITHIINSINSWIPKESA